MVRYVGVEDGHGNSEVVHAQRGQDPDEHGLHGGWDEGELVARAVYVFADAAHERPVQEPEVVDLGEIYILHYTVTLFIL